MTRRSGERLAVLCLMAATGVLYMAGLDANGWANLYYSGAAQAGATSWKAFFYGALDGAGGITVDKPPVSIWVMALSVRAFGANPWSVLLPQAIAGVACVGVFYATVRRCMTAMAALLSAAILAVTPVAVLIFRYNHPDAVLLLLLTLGAYATLRAAEHRTGWWLALAGACVGFGFLTKLMQALLVVPVFAATYQVAAAGSWRRRMSYLGLAAAVALASASWWIAIVELVPSSARPWIGGTRGNSVLDLALGYNGLDRLTSEHGPAGAFGAGSAGVTRLFNDGHGGQIGWLLPTALVGLAAGLTATRRSPRTDRVRAAFLLWGGWMLTVAVVFSFMRGIYHPYYTVMLAPPVAALTGMGTALLWQRRERTLAAAVLAAALTGTAVWAVVLLRRSPPVPTLLLASIAGAPIAAGALLLTIRVIRRRAVVILVGVLGLTAALAGPVHYAIETTTSAHTGLNPLAGPPLRHRRPPAVTAPARNAAPPPSPSRRSPITSAATEAVADALGRDSAGATWVAATVGATVAARYQLATGRPVLALGGFTGKDPWPTLARFQHLVDQGGVRYFLAIDPGAGFDQDTALPSHQIRAWVTSTFTATTVGGVSVYDLRRRR